MIEILAEIRAAIVRLRILIEGYEDLSCRGLGADEDAEVDAHAAAANRRLRLLLDAEEAIDNLISDGYPALPRREISPDIMGVLQEKVAGITAALAEFEERQLTTTGIFTVDEESPSV